MLRMRTLRPATLAFVAISLAAPVPSTTPTSTLSSDCGTGNFTCTGSCVDGQGNVIATPSDEIETVSVIAGTPFARVYEASKFVKGRPTFESQTICGPRLGREQAAFPALMCQEASNHTTIKDIWYDSCSSFSKIIRRLGDGGFQSSDGGRLCQVRCVTKPD
eukprot:TRINITY_DN19944_c0_g1_i1.p2 TRINITY_DN19944_c0_g1~~TRINITY_DN19944_c0_g1_i1.p2  ORF type:complete len:162 (+),score=16.50 TRINITY_DN19944_c0_g1_i1:175-660(+)